MTDIPIEIFSVMLGTMIAIGVIGLWKNNPMVMFISGALITFLGIITDTIVLGQLPVTSTVSGSTTTYVFASNNFIFTEWHKIIFMLIGSVAMIFGAIENHNIKKGEIK
jgi:hypothetical protein